MNKTYVPLISSGVAGPLGVRHLPRLWQKVSLESRGKLADGYPGIGGGFDTMTINALGINPDAVRKFIADNLPTYPQFEAWVREQPGVKLDKAALYLHNQKILGYIHDDQTRRAILAANGIADENSVNPGAVDLNNLDDWYEFHQRVIMADDMDETLHDRTPPQTAKVAEAPTPEPAKEPTASACAE